MPGDDKPKSVPAAFMDAWNNHDMQALAALFVEDAHFVNVVGAWWKSRIEIEAAHKATHATIFKNSRLVGETGDVVRLGPNIYAVHLSWQLSGMNNPNGTPSAPRRGIMLFILTEEPEGLWRIKIAQNTDIVEGAVVPQQAA